MIRNAENYFEIQIYYLYKLIKLSFPSRIDSVSISQFILIHFKMHVRFLRRWTRRPKGPFAVSWPRQLGEYNEITITKK